MSENLWGKGGIPSSLSTKLIAMGGLPQTSRRIRGAGLALAICLGVLSAGPAQALTTLFFENFDGLQLQPPVQEFWPFPDAFTHDAPSGWFRDASDVPGVGTPSVGIFEWEGWSFANERFWTEVNQGSAQQPTPRDFFELGEGTVAVADPDRWNDLGDPANNIGFFNTLLRTPPIDVSPAAFDERLVVQFDSSWLGGCCDDGANFDPGGNNQTAIVRAVSGTQRIELLRWESAPFIDSLTGDRTDQPFNDAGQPNEPNPFFKPDNFNERVVLDLSQFLPDQPPGGLPFALASGIGSIGLEFEMADAGDDGFWAFDSVEMVSYSTLLGDMDLSGVLDMGDFAAFALGMLDEEEYRFSYFGEFPESRGSLDSNFDFDDAAWFIQEMDMAGVSPSAAMALAQAFAGVPEPTTLAMLALAASLAPRRRVGSDR